MQQLQRSIITIVTLKVEFLTDHFTPATTQLPRPTWITNIGTLQCYLQLT